MRFFRPIYIPQFHFWNCPPHTPRLAITRYITWVGEGNTFNQHCRLFIIFTMSFFDSVRTQNYNDPVTILVNEESVSLSEAQYRGKSVSQLVAEYAGNLVDVARVNRYLINGTAVSGDTQVRPGETVRVAISSESKG